MTNQTSTRAAMAEREKDYDAQRLADLQRTFREQYAPPDARGQADFEVHLVRLMQEVARSATKPFQDAAAAYMLQQPFRPVVLKSDP